MELDPRELEARVRYRLMIGCIVPRPIAVVSTISPDGRPNLAPFSFGSEKDTLKNCKPVEEGGTGEFVVNLALEAYRREVAAAGEPLAYGDSEFDFTGLGTAASRVVSPPRLAESPVAFECRTMQVMRLAPGVAGGANVVVGEIVHLYVRDDIVDEDLHVLPDRLPVIGRLGGLGYCTIRDRFDLPRGRAALTADDP
jgi:flavin reductase (DIM6/NTAB) family NADH-FMN oxidoreductase RutF